MGVDLRLLVIDGDHLPEWGYSHTMLGVERRRELWEPIWEIQRQRGRVVPEKFSTFLARHDGDGGCTYGSTTDTPYGEPLRYVLAGDLVPLADHETVLDNDVNRATWAYLGALNPATKVALYWH